MTVLDIQLILMPSGITCRRPFYRFSLYVTNGLPTCVGLQWQGVKLFKSWDHYLPHMSEYLTHAYHNSWEAVALFC